MKNEFHVSRNTLASTFLLISLFASFLVVFTFVNGVSGASLEDVAYVKSEKELKNAINNASTDESVTISIDKDITLTNALNIPTNKDITLTSNKANGFYKLIGASDKSTIVVEDGGVLRLDGVIVTHVTDDWGSGLVVSVGGQFFMYSGEISGNSAALVGYWGSSSGLNSYGGGVQNLGVFEMSGGKISNNIANHGLGGGVYNKGTFKMFGGEISNNIVYESTSSGGFGGGVYNDYGGSFIMSGGKISNNKAPYNGGGVCTYGVFERLGGVISGNTASKGNDVYPDGDGDGLSNGNNGLSNGNNGLSNGNNGLSNGNNGGNGTSVGDGGLFWGVFSLRDVVFICVGVAIVVVGVVVAVLLFTSKKDLKYIKNSSSSGKHLC